MTLSGNMGRKVAELCGICHLAWQKGLMCGWSGNASVRAPSGKIIITAAGSAKGFLGAADCLVLTKDGDISSGLGSPSSETGLHLAIYGACPECGAILHTHPGHLQALDLRNGAGAAPAITAIPLYEAQMWGRRLYAAADSPPGSALLAEAAAAALPPGVLLPAAVWLPRHGLCAVAKNLRDALCLTEELEHLAAVALAAPAQR